MTVLAFVLGVFVSVVAFAFWLGATRKTPAEQAADDLEQQLALWPEYEEHA